MNRIEVHCLNPQAIADAEKMLVLSARLTQAGHKMRGPKDFFDLAEKPYSDQALKRLIALPHPTLQKFGLINMVVIGASRRFLAQITRHQNEVKFMSASLQYSDYGDSADFVVPLNLLGPDETLARSNYIEQCERSMREYKSLTALGISHDEAGYCAPQALRNVLIISATPYQWKHMIRSELASGTPLRPGL